MPLYVALIIGVLLGAAMLVVVAIAVSRRLKREPDLEGGAFPSATSKAGSTWPASGTEGPERREAWVPQHNVGPPPHFGTSDSRSEPGSSNPPPGVSPDRPPRPKTADVKRQRVVFAVGANEAFRKKKVELAEELSRSTAEETEEERRRRFKELCLSHHPDKNNNSEESKSLFQFLQAQKESYLKGPLRIG